MKQDIRLHAIEDAVAALVAVLSATGQIERRDLVNVVDALISDMEKVLSFAPDEVRREYAERLHFLLLGEATSEAVLRGLGHRNERPPPSD